ncbi:MAG TPA: acetyl-CoA carboxylase biotin carboxyl carrier protein [Rhizobium sp.]|nr:acetyl-CoA carboxylase biotin carboxyl carrier protein [Rhizobium sp.]
MDLILIGKLMEMLENSALGELEVTEDGVRIRLSKTPRGEARAASATSSRPETPEAMAAAEIAELMALPSADEGSLEVAVPAGLPGTFYRAPAPDAAPYVSEGDLVEEGQTLALIEAMKMLNPVEAPQSGRIIAILIADATPVATGTPLIVIDAAD